MFRSLVVAIFVVAVTRAVAAAGEEPAAATGGYRIGAGDELEISVWKNEQLSRTVTVRPDGMISLPLVNDVQAADHTPMELRETLAKKLGDYVPSAEVSVIVKTVRSFQVSVIGAVEKPGHFDLAGPTTVLDALAMAGGLTEFASRRGIFVLRTDKEGSRRMPFNYGDAMAASAGKENFGLRPNDIVVVP